MTRSKTARWFAVSVFALASTWNYLDRAALSSQAPRIRAEFHLNNESYGWLLSAFSLSYALASPAVGWFLDFFGLETGVTAAVGLWSLATVLTGFTRTFPQLVASRIFLGIWESAGVPAAGKLNGTYLEPKNRALGAAITQVGLSIGLIAAPFLVAKMQDWRAAFLVCGAAGLLWLPVWVFTRRTVPPLAPAPRQRGASSLALLAQPRLIVLSVANILWMMIYSVWSGWTTPYLVYKFGLTTETVAIYAWIPPLGAVLGGFAGGWLAKRSMARSNDALQARSAAILVSALGCLLTALVPWCSSPAQASTLMAISWFWCVAGSVNLYTIPVDLWGPERAGTAVSALVFSFGLMGTVINPWIGHMADLKRYADVMILAAFMPLVSWVLVRWTGKLPG